MDTDDEYFYLSSETNESSICRQFTRASRKKELRAMMTSISKTKMFIGTAIQTIENEVTNQGACSGNATNDSMVGKGAEPPCFAKSSCISDASSKLEHAFEKKRRTERNPEKTKGQSPIRRYGAVKVLLGMKALRNESTMRVEISLKVSRKRD